MLQAAAFITFYESETVILEEVGVSIYSNS